MRLFNYIAKNYNGNVSRFADEEGYHLTQVNRYLAQDAEIDETGVYFKKYLRLKGVVK